MFSFSDRRRGCQKTQTVESIFDIASLPTMYSDKIRYGCVLYTYCTETTTKICGKFRKFQVLRFAQIFFSNLPCLFYYCVKVSASSFRQSYGRKIDYVKKRASAVIFNVFPKISLRFYNVVSRTLKLNTSRNTVKVVHRPYGQRAENAEHFYYT